MDCPLSKGAGFETSLDAARTSVPIPFRITMGMKVKDLPPAASLTFEGARATKRVGDHQGASAYALSGDTWPELIRSAGGTSRRNGFGLRIRRSWRSPPE